jgi:tetratricopeptide (TPR) repeat protein
MEFLYDGIAEAWRAYEARDWAGIAQIVGILSAGAAAVGFVLYRFGKLMTWAWRKSLAPLSARWPRYIARPSADPRDTIGRTLASWRVEWMLRRLRLVTHGRPKGVAIIAHGGMGKTTLARLYFNVHCGGHEGAFWLDAQDETTLLTQISAIGDQLDLKRPDGQSPEDRMRAVWAEVERRARPWLLIFDNAGGYRDTAGEGAAPAIKGLHRYLPGGRRVRIIVTSRESDWPETVFRTLKLPPLSPSKAAELLERESHRTDDRLVALTWAEEMDRMPLLLVLAGGYVRDGDISLAEGREAFDALAEKGAADGYMHKVGAMLDLTLDRIAVDAKTGLDEVALLDLLPWLAPEGMDARLVLDVAKEDLVKGNEAETPDAIRTLADHPVRLQAAISALARRSLAVAAGEGADRTVTLHRITAQILRARQDAEALARRRAAAAVVAASYPGDIGNLANWAACQRLNPHVAALAKCIPAAAGADLNSYVSAALAYILHHASAFYQMHASCDLAIEYARILLRLAITSFGSSSSIVGDAHDRLGASLGAADQWDEAVASLREALRIAEMQGPDYSKLGTRLSNLAATLADQAIHAGSIPDSTKDYLAECEDLLRRAYKQDRRVCGVLHFWTGMRLSNLGGVCKARGEMRRAQRISALALATLRKAVPPGDLRLANTLHNLGVMYVEDHAPQRAQALLEEALAILETAFANNPRHPYRMLSARWLAACRLALPVPDVAGTRALCVQYGFDYDAHACDAAQYRPPPP